MLKRIALRFPLPGGVQALRLRDLQVRLATLDRQQA
jgi:hypothetical protein